MDDGIDFSAFSRDDFDSVKWLNSIFSIEPSDSIATTKTTHPNKEMIATNLVYKLQLMVEETNNSLEDIAQRMASSIPKVIGEADVLSREAAELAVAVIDARTKMIGAVQQSSNAVDSLIGLDRTKHRLQETYKALQEANNWTTLTVDVEEVFESGDTRQIAQKLANMQQSLEVLSLTSSSSSSASPTTTVEPHIREKQQTLERLKDRFVTMIGPTLHESFLGNRVESIEFYAKLFAALHRFDHLIAQYHRCLRDQLVSEWRSQVQLDAGESLLNWLNFLYDRLTTMWKTQMSVCVKQLYPDDFGRSLRTLCDIYTDIMMSLEPTIESCIETHLKRRSSAEVSSQLSTTATTAGIERQKALIELKQFTNTFMRSIEQHIIGAARPTLDDINDFVSRIASFDILIRTIYRPFATFNDTFLQLEADRLTHEFDMIKSSYESGAGRAGSDDYDNDNDNSNGRTAAATMMMVIVSSECVIRLFTIARQSLKLYSEYVESYPVSVVDVAIEPFLCRFFAEFHVYLRENINRHLSKSGANLKSEKSSTATTTTTAASGLLQHHHHRRTDSSGQLRTLNTSASANSLNSWSGGGASASFSSPNWQVIQQALFGFQIVGEFWLQLQKLQQQIRLHLEEANQQQQPQHQHKQIESTTKTTAPNRSISYINRFDIFILNLDSNIELRDQIENHLHALSPTGSILAKVSAECAKCSRASAQAVCDSILDYVHLHLSSFFDAIRFQLQQQQHNRGDDDGDQSVASEDDLAFSPNEYITQIGQYLLTLPQHLEPFNPNDNAALKIALKGSIDVFVISDSARTSLKPSLVPLPVVIDRESSTAVMMERIEMATTEFLLDSILRLTTRAFTEHILQLSESFSAMNSGDEATATIIANKPTTGRKLSAAMQKQIAVDLAYLMAVCEDLGLTSNEPEFLVLVRIFNESHSKQAFEQMVEQYPTHLRMLRSLENILQLS